jgi:hypothetical protein
MIHWRPLPPKEKEHEATVKNCPFAQTPDFQGSRKQTEN